MEGLGETKGSSKSSPISSYYSTPRHSVSTEQHKWSPFYNLIKYLKILSNQTSVYINYSLRAIFTVRRRVEGSPIEIPTLQHRQSKCL
jgi:hypothetical protein